MTQSFQAGPLVNLAVGGEYDAFGKNLFTELSGFLTFYRSRHVNDYNEDSAPWTEALTQFDRQCPLSLVDGGCPITSETEPLLVALINDNPDAQSVGWVGKIDGGAMPFGAPNFAWGDPIRISTKREVAFHGTDLVTGMFFEQTGEGRTSLFIGPSYKRLNQESETFAYESNRDPEVNNLTLKEDLEAWYYGGVVGTRIDLPFKERWHFTFDGRLGAVLPGFRIQRIPKDVAVVGGPGLRRADRLENKRFGSRHNPQLPNGAECHVPGERHLSTRDRSRISVACPEDALCKHGRKLRQRRHARAGAHRVFTRIGSF